MTQDEVFGMVGQVMTQRKVQSDESTAHYEEGGGAIGGGRGEHNQPHMFPFSVPHQWKRDMDVMDQTSVLICAQLIADHAEETDDGVWTEEDHDAYVERVWAEIEHVGDVENQMTGLGGHFEAAKIGKIATELLGA